MIQLRRPVDETRIRHMDDVVAIRDALHDDGYDASFADIQWAWEQASSLSAAGWLAIDDYSLAASVVRDRLEEVE